MAEKPTYKQLEERIKELEQEKIKNAMMNKSVIHDEKWPTQKIVWNMNPEIHIPEVDLASIINAEEIQSIMDDFCSLTNMVTAVLDLKGRVIEATGWQDICTKFHRIHPETARSCTESDLFLAQNLKPGEYVDYKCKNGLWDVVTPLYVGTKHLGNIYTGQFFYDDEQIDEDFFIKQAEAYGFDKDSYLEAFQRIPRYNRETVNHLMSFLVKFTTYISRISLLNIELKEEIRERKQLEDALKESEAHLRTLIRTIPDLVWLKDIQGRYLFCNSRFESFFGAKENDIIGKTDYEFVNKELADFFRKHDKMALDNGKPTRNEEDVTFADDGHREILETIKTPIYRRDGQIVGVLGIGRDITDRKRLDDRLRESESFIKSVMDSLPIGIAVNSVDPAVQFEYMNDNFPRFYRTTRAALTEPDGFWTSVYEDPDFREEIKKKVVADSASGDPARMYWEDVPIVRKGEAAHFITARNIPIPEKKLMISTVWDVTDRKQADEALRENEKKYQYLFNNAQVALFRTTIEGKLIEINKRYAEIAGYSTVEDCMDSFNPGKAWADPIGRNELVNIIQEKGFVTDYEAKIIRRDGIHIWILFSAAVYPEQGFIEGSLVEITDRKKAEEEILKLNRDLELRVYQRTVELEEANKELEDFVYSVSHDLRAPLRSISGFAEIIDRRHKLCLNEEGRHYFDNIIKASRQMGDLIDDLLQFSRLGRKAIKIENVPLDDVFETAMETLADSIQKTDAQINIPENMPVIQGDMTLATHVVINLLENAIKYRKSNALPMIDVRLETEDQYAVVSIADNGIGIEEQYHEKIFNIFQRLHSQDAYPGTGIGLAAVKKALQIMGGQVRVESEPGKGSVFKIKFLQRITA